MANWLFTPSVWDIRSQRGSGTDSALLLVQDFPDEELCRAQHIAHVTWFFLLHFPHFYWCSLSKRPAYSSKAPCWGHASVASPWSVQIWGEEVSLFPSKALDSCKGMRLFWNYSHAWAFFNGKKQLVMSANLSDFPFELQKFLCSLYFLMSFRYYGGRGKETPWGTAPARQTKGLFPGHYTSACHLCYSWNYCPTPIIRVRLWQLFPPLAGFPAASYPSCAWAWSQQGFLCWIPWYLCARQKKIQVVSSLPIICPLLCLLLS